MSPPKPTRPRARAVRPAAPDRVVWRDGVQLAGTPIWCDAGRARELCFVSHAGVPGADRHRQIIATADAVALFPGRPPGAGRAAPRRAQARLTPLYARPFSLGELRLEIFPSGYDRGAASLVVDVRGARVAYAGALPAGIGAPGWPGEARAADALVVDASSTHPRHRFLPPAQAAADLDAFVAEARAAGQTPVVLVGSPVVAMAVVAHLGRAGAAAPLAAHRGFVEAARRRRALDPAFPALRRAAFPLAEGEIVLWPAGRRLPAWPAGAPSPRIVLTDGSAVDLQAVVSAGAHHGIAWSDRAGHDDLLGYVAMSGASEVWALGGADEAFVSALAARGVRVRRLGPPAQLALWG